MGGTASWSFMRLVRRAPSRSRQVRTELAQVGLDPLDDQVDGRAHADVLHHRAALFLAVFVACIWAAFIPDGRRLAVIVVAISMISFLALYLMSGSPAGLTRIAIADMIGIPALLAVAWMAFRP